jgi:hypothetical protein
VTGVTLVLALALSVSACSGSDSSSPRASSSPTTATDAATPLQDLDTTALVVRRSPFCDAVDPAAVERALGGEPADVSAYRSGQRIKISNHGADVVHEFGCRWTAGDNTAEAWVFAPPVTRERAAGLARDIDKLSVCADGTGPAFGEPWARCLTRQGEAAKLTYGGLFGDAWLGCTLTLTSGSIGDVDERGEQWCAAVATGAASLG